jgi:hypothetical protein
MGRGSGIRNTPFSQRLHAPWHKEHRQIHKIKKNAVRGLAQRNFKTLCNTILFCVYYF